MIMTNDEYKNYVYDLGSLLKEKAKEAKKEKDAATNTAEADFKLGYLMAMHEVVSLMKQQADAFGIEQESLGLEDIDPELHLL